MVAVPTAKLTDEQRDRAESEFPMAESLAHRHARRTGDMARGRLDEYLSAAHMGLVEAARIYRDDMGHPFRAVARVKVRGAILDMITDQQRPKHRLVRDFLGDGGPDVPDHRPTPFCPTEVAETAEAIDRAMATLGSTSRAVLRGHYFDGLQLSQIAARMGWCRVRASEVHSLALNAMRSCLAPDEPRRAGGRKRSLTPAVVLEIRRRHAEGEPIAGLAREFRVARNTVKDIVRRRTWAHLPEALAPAP